MERRTAVDDLVLLDREAADYEGGYLDGKYVSRGFIADVARRGSEPARWAFEDAIVVFAREPGLDELVRAAAAYPERERDKKLRSFVAHLKLMTWFHSEAEKRADAYLLAFASTRLVLYAGRAILAHNRMLYPYHKWFTTILARAPERPVDLLERIRLQLAEPTRAHAEALAASIVECVGVDVPLAEAASRFTRETEWSWRLTGAPLDES